MVVRLAIMVRLVMQGLCAASTKISQSCKRCGQPSDLLLLQAVWMRRNSWSRMTQPKPITTYQPIIANLTTYLSFTRGLLCQARPPFPPTFFFRCGHDFFLPQQHTPKHPWQLRTVFA